ncbi:MAG: hypothetical protein LBL69_02295, partial [Zoogloeaceae bacterium]|nr:hypothetical protein [Zoogloeaceae bacterium]
MNKNFLKKYAGDCLWVLLLVALALLGILPGLSVAQEVRRGELLLTDPSGKRVAAPLVETRIEAQLSGVIGRVKVIQTFRNPGDQPQEAIYAFPLPEQAAVDQLHVEIGERRIEGQIQERAQARRTYAKAKREGKRAALVEQWRPNIFTTRVAPIGPQEKVVVSLE